MKIRKIWRRSGSFSLLLWILAYAGLVFTILAFASIGYLVAPFALVFFLAVVVFAHFWPEAPLGAFIGTGLMCLLVAFGNRDYVPCPSESLGSAGTSLGPGQGSFSCGGMNPVPWLVVGILLTGTGVIGYFLFTTLSNRLKIHSSEFE